MCGICGIYNTDATPVQHDELVRMNATMRDRGPDGEGFFQDSCFGMGMRRLAIIDLAGGGQPVSNEDGTIHIVLNGEIYNYVELRRDLEQRGHIFRSHSDVEVLAHLYEEKGLDAVHDLNGMFAFCLWDARLRRAWLVRDRLGIKPLVWRADASGITFGSTLDALRARGGWVPELDEDALLLLLALAYVPAPRTIWRGVHKLLPGHWMTVDAEGCIATQQYWTPEQHATLSLSPHDFHTTAVFDTQDAFDTHLRTLLEDSVRMHARSDVPVGCYLSGGLDSSFVTALFCRHQGEGVSTLNMEFSGKKFSESPLAAEVAARYGTRHCTHTLHAAQGLPLIDELAPRLDEPLGDSAILPSYILSRTARDLGLKVMLSGAGGDELFGGYARHWPSRHEGLVRLLSALPRNIWDALIRVSPGVASRGYRVRHHGLRMALATSAVNLGVLYTLLRDKDAFFRLIDLLEEHTAPALALRQKYGFTRGAMLTDCVQYLPDNILAVQDKTSSAASLEGRVPLLDHRIVELAFSAPAALAVPSHPAEGKKVLRRLAYPLLPKSIFNRPKTGFNAPVHHWLSGSARTHTATMTAEILAGCRTSLLDTAGIPALFQKDTSLEATETLFLLRVLACWSQHHAI